jgi:hypothetical protein
MFTDALGVLWFTICLFMLVPFCSISLFIADRR